MQIYFERRAVCLIGNFCANARLHNFLKKLVAKRCLFFVHLFRFGQKPRQYAESSESDEKITRFFIMGKTE